MPAAAATWSAPWIMSPAKGVEAMVSLMSPMVSLDWRRRLRATVLVR